MSIVQIVFSPTGGTQKAADIITAEWGTHNRTIDLTNAAADYTSIRLEADDLVLIAVPSYGGRVPALAAQRLAAIHGNQANAVIACVYGNRAYEDTLVELNDIAVQSNFRVIAAISAVAEHSIMHQYAAGRPDQQDTGELRGFAKRILEELKNDRISLKSMLSIPGNRPYKKSGGASLIPKADDSCNHCGLCVKGCPAQAISPEEPAVTDSKKCISCMRCIAICPKSARKVNSVMVSAAALAMKKVCSVRKGNELFI